MNNQSSEQVKQIMLFSADSEFRRDFKKYFANSPDILMAIDSSEPDRVIKLLELSDNKSINIMIADADYSTQEDFIKMITSFSWFIPESRKIIISRSSNLFGDFNILNRLMRLGDVQILSKPIKFQQLAELIIEHNQVADSSLKQVEQKDSAECQKIAFVSASGGVGKTTLAINIAEQLSAVHPGRVLALDFDIIYGNLATAMNLSPTNLKCFDALAGTFKDFAEIDRSALEQHLFRIRGLDLVPSNRSLLELDLSLQDEGFHIIKKSEKFYDYQVIDTPVFIQDELLSAAISEADILFVVLTPRINSIRNTHLFSGLLDKLGIKSQRRVYLVNRFVQDRDEDVLKAIQKFSGAADIIWIPESGSAFDESFDMGQPLIYRSPDHPVSQLLRNISQGIERLNFSGINHSKMEAEQKLFSRLKGIWDSWKKAPDLAENNFWQD